MSTASRGAARENKIKDLLEEKGWIVVRGAGSKGIDLMALKRGFMAKVIEVKTDKAGPWAHFGPKDRADLHDAALTANAEASLWHWPANKPLIIYGEDSWPKN